MKQTLLERIKNSRGATIVEATFVFPIMFFIVLLLVFLGNAYYQRSQIEAVVTEAAFEGAARCTDPFHTYVKDKRSVPSFGFTNDFEPYRYIVGGMKSIEGDIKTEMEQKLVQKTVSVFNGMRPQFKNLGADYSSYIVYSTFSTQAEYEIVFPIKMFFSDYIPIFKYKVRAEVPVNDTPDFVRNVDMVVDYVKQSGIGDKIANTIADKFTKITNFLKDIGIIGK